jgi:hypothetical protein
MCRLTKRNTDQKDNWQQFLSLDFAQANTSGDIMKSQIILTQWQQTAANTSGNRVFSGICFMLQQAENCWKDTVIL